LELAFRTETNKWLQGNNSYVLQYPELRRALGKPGREERKSKSKASAMQSCRGREKNVKKFGVSAICGERKQTP
jgi:hypothetical protein